jgi:hypothetical protein
MKLLNYSFSLVSSIMLWGLLHSSNTQEHYFKVFFSGKEVGDLKINLKRNGLIETIEIKSISFVKVLFAKADIDYHGTCTYNENVLIESYCRNIVDDEVKTYSKISKQQDNYLIHNENEKKEVELKPITFSLLRMYFQEPKGMSSVFSESWGQYCPLKVVGTRTYELALPNGKKSKYIYNEKSQLIRVENNHIMGKIAFEKVY